jgi:uncharacterized protein (TIGR02284 family)
MQFIQTNINTVHAALMDSIWGYKECASVVPDSRLKEKFENIALDRERMLRELEIRGGATKSTSGSVKGSMSRTWTKIKSSLSSGVQHVLDDLATEEANLRKTYDNALKSSACDSALNGLLFMHLRSIECHLSQLRIICGEAKYGNKWDVSAPSTGEIIKEKLQTTGVTLKGKMQSTGQTISSKLTASGIAIKDKLGLGQQSQTQTETATMDLDLDDTTVVTTEQPTTGQNIKAKLQATGIAIKENLQATGTAIKDKFSGGQNQSIDTTINSEQHTTGEQIKEKLQATGTVIKDKAQATGIVIKDKAQVAGTAIKDKLGMGQAQQQEFNTVNSNITSDV